MGNSLRMRKTLVKHLKNTVPESVIGLTTSGEKNMLRCKYCGSTSLVQHWKQWFCQNCRRTCKESELIKGDQEKDE